MSDISDFHKKKFHYFASKVFKMYFLVDDDSGLAAIGSVRWRNELL